MIVFGTYLGIALLLFIAFLFVTSVRWQIRFGSFWPYSVMFLLFAAFIGMSTFVESTTLSNASLERMLPDNHSVAKTVDELRPFIIARNNSLMITGCGFIFILSALLGALTLSKAKRLQRQHQMPNDRNA